MNFFSSSRMMLASSIGVNPAACTSFNNGSVIFPSGRTGATRVSWSSLQTSIFKTSCGLICGGSCLAFRAFCFYFLVVCGGALTSCLCPAHHQADCQNYQNRAPHSCSFTSVPSCLPSSPVCLILYRRDL